MQYLKTIRLSVFAAGLVALVAVGASTNTNAAASSGSGNLTLYCQFFNPAVSAAGASNIYYNLTLREARLQVRAIVQLGVTVQGTPFEVVLVNLTGTSNGADGTCFAY